jgi:hypothetical protein
LNVAEIEPEPEPWKVAAEQFGMYALHHGAVSARSNWIFNSEFVRLIVVATLQR